MHTAPQPIIADTAAQLAVLRSVNLDWARHLQSVWHDTPHDAAELNGPLANDIIDELVRCDQPDSLSPLGRVIMGPAGSGKTHLVGNLRKRAWEKGAWFVLLDLTDVSEFWAAAALSYLQSLQQHHTEGADHQGDKILLSLSEQPLINSTLKSKFRQIFTGQGQELVNLAEAIVDALRSSYPSEAQRYRDVIRAFVMLRVRDPQISDIAYSWLQGIEVEEGIFGPTKSPQEVVRGLSWLMSLTGPTLLVVDQIDAIVSEHNHALESSERDSDESKALTIIDGLAGGLMDLRDVTRRTLTVLSTLEATWNVLVNRALRSATDRFREPNPLRNILRADVAQKIIVSRLQEAYGKSDFHPPYPSWPFDPRAFHDAIGRSPRMLLKRCDAHLRHCFSEGHVIDLHTFAEPSSTRTPKTAPPALDEKFRALVADARVDDLVDPEEWERLFPSLLLDALECYVLQTDVPNDVDLFVDADPHQSKPALHARLTTVYRSEGDREIHHCFRAIPHAHPRAFQSRLKAAITSAGIDLALPFRHLFIIRRDEPPTGPTTRQMCEDFRRAGGKFIALGKDDLKIMLALQTLLKGRPDDFETWLRRSKPLCEISLFREAGLCAEAKTAVAAKIEAATGISRTGKPEGIAETQSQHRAEGTIGMHTNEADSAPKVSEAKQWGPPPQRSEPLSIPVGRRLIGGRTEQPRVLALNLLPRHTAILAGSGSGKTVLLRRIVEEAALLGVPSIVLDTNNDLARLGDPWPEVPTAFEEPDRAKAETYRERIETVVWTPGIAGGNPIMLAPMPDFAPVHGDEDELQQTVVMAHAALKPLIGASGSKAVLKEGVLMQALQHFACSGEEGLDPFVRLLSDLPPEVSNIDDAAKIAAAMANLIKAEIAKNPLLSFKGTPLDPQALLASGKNCRTRISIINFSGLPADEAKQAFVNQLEMTLFSWIKKNPPPQDRPLTGLLVMDEAQNFAPSQKSTPCKESTIALVAQARKYGLGMVFATQVPKNIDNKIISNCTTHFYGKMNSPATIEATRELMAAKGGSGSDIASMKAGDFYFTTEGMTAPEKIKTPLCLSHHPQNPLGQEDVVKRARASRMVT